LIPLRPDIFAGRVEGDDFCPLEKQARSPKPDIMLRPDIFVGRVEGDDFCPLEKRVLSPKPDIMQGISNCDRTFS
jgi:hypothetical protein